MCSSVYAGKDVGGDEHVLKWPLEGKEELLTVSFNYGEPEKAADSHMQFGAESAWKMAFMNDVSDKK